MRTYRWILVAGGVLMISGLLGATLFPGPDSGPREALRLIRSIGQLLLVVGAAGLLMVLLTRGVIQRRSSRRGGE